MEDGKITLDDVVALGYAASISGVERANADGLLTLSEFRWLRIRNPGELCQLMGG